MYSSKTDLTINWLIFSALLLTTMHTSIFSNEDAPESETHITKENDQSYLTSMLNMLGSLTKKVTTTVSSSPAMIKKLLAGTMILLAATSGTAAENCLTTIKLNPHDLPVCYALDQRLPSSPVNPFTRAVYEWTSVAVAQCKTIESGDCIDVCSSHGEVITFNDVYKNTRFYSPLPPYDLPKESNFALCPANVTNFKQRILNNQEPASANLALEQLNKNANITKTLLLPRTDLLHDDFINNHIGVVYQEPDCRKGLPHQKKLYTMETLENCIAKGPYPHRRKVIDGKKAVDIFGTECFVRVTEE